MGDPYKWWILLRGTCWLTNFDSQGISSNYVGTMVGFKILWRFSLRSCKQHDKWYDNNKEHKSNIKLLRNTSKITLSKINYLIRESCAILPSQSHTCFNNWKLYGYIYMNNIHCSHTCFTSSLTNGYWCNIHFSLLTKKNK